MPDFTATLALAATPGAAPQRLERVQLTISEVPVSGISVLRGNVAAATMPPGWAVLVHGPDKALAVSTSGAVEVLEVSGCVVTDVSDARTCLRIEGARALELLSAGCPIDFGALADGACAASVLGTYHVLLHRHGAERVDVFVTRSFAAALWDWLGEASSEYRAA